MSSPINPTIPSVITTTMKSKKAQTAQLNRLRNAFQHIDDCERASQVRRWDKNRPRGKYTDQFEDFMVKKLVYLTLLHPVGHPV